MLILDKIYKLLLPCKKIELSVHYTLHFFLLFHTLNQSELS